MTTIAVLPGFHRASRKLGHRCVTANETGISLTELHDGGTVSELARLPSPLRLYVETVAE